MIRLLSLICLFFFDNICKLFENVFLYKKKFNIIKSINELYLIFYIFLILICKKFFKNMGFMKF